MLQGEASGWKHVSYKFWVVQEPFQPSELSKVLLVLRSSSGCPGVREGKERLAWQTTTNNVSSSYVAVLFIRAGDTSPQVLKSSHQIKGQETWKELGISSASPLITHRPKISSSLNGLFSSHRHSFHFPFTANQIEKQLRFPALHLSAVHLTLIIPGNCSWQSHQ